MQDDHLKRAIQQLFNQECAIKINIHSAAITALFTPASLFKFLSIWISEGLTSLQFEQIQVITKSPDMITAKCTVACEMDGGIAMVFFVCA